MDKQIGNKIRKIRELKGFSQDYMATQLDISQRSYSKLENQEIKLSWDRISQISKILKIDPVELVTFDDSLVFHNCNQSGKFENFNHNFPKELKEQYEKQIAHLEQEVIFLREQLKAKSLK